MKVVPGNALMQGSQGSAATAPPSEQPRSDAPRASGQSGGAPEGQNQRVETRPVQESSGSDRPRPDDSRGRKVDVRA